MFAIAGFSFRVGCVVNIRRRPTVRGAHQAEDELPFDSQIAELKAAVAAAGATCEVVTDAGISGTDFEHRPGLQEIIARAREPKPNFQ